MHIFRNRLAVTFQYLGFSIVALALLLGVVTVYSSRVVVINDSPFRVHMVLLAASGGIILLLGVLLYRLHRIGKKLARNEELFRAVFENTAMGLVHVSRAGKMLHANEAFCNTLGYEREEVMSPDFQFADIFFSDTARTKLFGDSELKFSVSNRSVLIEPCRSKDDKLLWLDLYVEFLESATGNGQSYIIAIVDATRQRNAAAELAEYRENLEKIVDERTRELKKSEARFRFIAEHNHDVIWTMDLKTHKLTYVSPSVQQLRGVTPLEAVQESPWEAFEQQSRDSIKKELNELLDSFATTENRERFRKLEGRQFHKSGRLIDVELAVSVHPDEKGRPSSLLGVTHDITERKRAEDELRRMAFYDGLTALPNRRLLYDRLRQAIRHARRRKRRIALLFIDLDKFKPVNDELGHQTGDWLLRQVAQRMQDGLRAYDTAARMGGDEFIILLPDLDNMNDALIIAERVRSAIERPFVTDDNIAIEISTSIGVALFPDHANSEHDLMRAGDDAMYQAKREGRNRVEILAVPSIRPEAIPWLPEKHDVPLRLSWNDSFACGDAQMDAEHQNLFELANHVINAAMTMDTEPNLLSGVLDSLLTDISQHFQHEEEFLARLKWPALKEHVQKHRILLDRAVQLRNAAESNELPMGALVDFLAVEIIVQHILTDDRQYFSCLGHN